MRRTQAASWTDLGRPLSHGCYRHKTSMPLPPIVARQHRGYLLERRRKDSFPSTRASYSIQCLFVLLRIRVVRGIVGWLGVGTSVINLGKYNTRLTHVGLQPKWSRVLFELSHSL